MACTANDVQPDRSMCYISAVMLPLGGSRHTCDTLTTCDGGPGLGGAGVERRAEEACICVPLPHNWHHRREGVLPHKAHIRFRLSFRSYCMQRRVETLMPASSQSPSACNLFDMTEGAAGISNDALGNSHPEPSNHSQSAHGFCLCLAVRSTRWSTSRWLC